MIGFSPWSFETEGVLVVVVVVVVAVVVVVVVVFHHTKSRRHHHPRCHPKTGSNQSTLAGTHVSLPDIYTSCEVYMLA